MTTRQFRVDEDEYSVVSLQPSWGLLALAIFFFSLPLRFWARWSPWHPRQYYYEPGTMALGIIGLAAAGMFVAWIGTRTGSHPRLARWALLLNATVAGLMALIALAGFVYWRFLR